MPSGFPSTRGESLAAQLTGKSPEQKIAHPRVLELLKPLTTPGQWQPGDDAIDTCAEHKPVSFERLTRLGALHEDAAGIRQLWLSGNARLGGSAHPDPNRPHWDYPARFSTLSPEQIEELRTIQAVLYDCGPLLVARGQLAP